MITSDSYVSKLFVESVISSDRKQRRAVSRKLFLHIFAVCEWVTDFFTCAALTLAVEFLEIRIGGPRTYPIHTILYVCAIVGLFVAVLLQRNHAASEWVGPYPVHQTVGAVRISFQGLMLILLGSVLLRPDVPLHSIVVALVLMPLALMLQKLVLASTIQILHNRSYCADRVVVYGAGEASRRITSALSLAPRLALYPVAYIDEDSGASDEHSSERPYEEPIEGPIRCTSITLDLLTSLHCDLLLIATTSLSTEQRGRLQTLANQAGARVEEVHPIDCVGVNELFRARKKRKASTGLYAFGKRIFDAITSAILLLLLSPIFALIALLIRLGSNGPALFIQKRVGRDGATFKMYKFRSMHYRARKYECSPKTSDDPRITKIGRFLRRSSLDELPQLINVFFGQMSLVGPRPEMPFIVRRYTNHQRQRLQVTPGITGLWQLSNDRAYPIHENLHHDLSYIQHRSLPLDVAILIHTLFFAMRGGV